MWYGYKIWGRFSNKCPNWIIDPFTADRIEVKVEIQENFIDLVADGDLKVKCLKIVYESFWTQENLTHKYPNIRKEIRLLFMAFTASYVVK